MFFNPAAMVLHPGNNFHSSASYIAPTAKTKNAAGTTVTTAPITGTGRSGDVGANALVPAVYNSFQVTDEIFLGLAVNSAHSIDERDGSGFRTWNFLLPRSWTVEGQISLTGVIDPNNDLSECRTCWDNNVESVNASFTWGREFVVQR